MLTARSSLGLLLSTALFLAIASTCPAQSISNATNTGLPENGVFHGSDVENVQVNNGNLHVDIPIWSVKGRGLDTSAHFVSDTKGWTYVTSCNPATGDCTDLIKPAPYPNSMILSALDSFSYSYSSNTKGIVCNNVTYALYSVKLRDPNGTSHQFLPTPFADTHNVCISSVPTTIYASDGSGWIAQAGPNHTWTFINKHGTTLPLVGPSIEDSNGNEMFSSNSTDTLGRAVNLTTYYDSNGTQRSFVTATTSVPIHTNLCAAVQSITGSLYCNELITTWTVPYQITLPNGQSYTFTYAQNAGGELASITLPSGAQISYTYSPGGDQAGRFVASRTVTVNGVASTWNYSYTMQSFSYDLASTVVTDPASNDTAYTCLVDARWLNSAPCYISSVQSYQGSSKTGTLLKTVATDYQFYQLSGGGSNGPITTYIVVPIRDTTTWNQQNLVRKVETDWDTTTTPFGTFTWQNPIERREYDWATSAPGPLLKRTHYNYLHLQNSAYLNKNIADRPTSVIVYDGAGNIKEQTTTTYDGSALTTTTGAPNHDYTNFSTSNLVRGNPTTISHWLNPGNTWLNTVNTYDDLGNLLTTTDPLQHTTTFSYTDNWANTSCVASGVNTHGYVTQVTNALSQNAQTSYYPCTGLAASRKDQNDINASRAGTTYSYDFFGRLTQKNTPDGGQTIVSYNDVPPVSNTTTTSINSAESAIATKVFDGLGRVIQTQLTSDPQGTVYTDTTYDLLGRTATVSNPYRVGTDITTSTGTTTYGYDALSRKITETYPDNSVLTTAFCGPSTLVSDPTGKWRRSRTDGLGRLVEVDEPNAPGASVASTGCPGTGEPIWVTSYTYDGLSNLTQVLQNGSRQRTFTYDSLSHLLTSTNPEVGQITYAYNNDGVLISKTDARNITTNYSPSDSPLDALHRVTKITYSNSDPSLTFAYDQSSCLALPHCDNIGHRTSMTDAAGSESWSFDVADRIHKEQRTTSGITKSTTYSLDLAGNIASVVYPTGRTVNYTYDSADRASSAADSANGITYATGLRTTPGGTCLNNVTCYTPQGTFYALSIGQTSSFTGVNLTHSYNNRLQPNEFKASSSGGSAIDITYGFVDPVSGKNAGHVYAITNNLDTTRSQTFTYDQLNRITTAQTASTHATSPAHCWAETYTLDAWANLQSIAQANNSNYTGCVQESGFSTTADGNNHIPAFGYDASGNATSDGVYSYAWDGESQLKSAAGINYLYDGDGRRVSKSNGKLYWYGSGGEILAETDASGNATAEYIFFGGKRIAMLPAGANPIYYVEDLLGTSRVVTTNTGVVCYDADFYPYGGERTVTNTCTQNNYKFEGKERDAETGNDDFGARYYSNRFGRWLSADWSNVPVPVPYANLSNPQTLNLYSMVADDPESFADLDGHDDGTAIQTSQRGGISQTSKACGPNTTTCNTTAQQLGQELEKAITILSGDSVGDSVIAGITKEVWNIVAGTADTSLNPGGLNHDTPQLPILEGSNPTEKMAMAGTAIAAVVAPIAAEVGAAGGASVQANRAAGNAFRDEVASSLKAAGRDVQTEVTKQTPFGRRVVDIEVKHNGKTLGGIETKTGKSPYKPSQRAKDAYLKQQGYAVNLVRKPPE